MKLTSIWTLPACTLRERIARTRELGWRTLAHCLPRKLAYWSFIDTGVRHFRHDEIVPEVPYTVLLQRAGS